MKAKTPEFEVSLSSGRPLTRGRVAARGPQGVAPEGRARQAYWTRETRTREEIAASRPANVASLETIHGVGPAFLKRHSENVLKLVRSLSRPP